MTILGIEGSALRRDPLIVTQSDLGAFKTCRRSWMMNTYLGLQAKEVPVYGPLTLGTRVHRALELYYGHALDPVEEYLRLVRMEKTQLEDDGVMYDERAFDNEAELGRLMLEGYLEWLEETGADAEYEVIGAEKKLTHQIEIDGVMVEIRGKVDLRWRSKRTGARLVVDHKTSINPARVIAGLPKNEQLKTYMLLERLADKEHADDWVQGAVFNVFRKVRRTMTSSPPYYFRAEQHHNDATLRAFWNQTYGTLQDYVQTVKRLDENVDHVVAAYPRPGEACSWCSFRRPCDLMDDGSRVEDLIKALYNVGDPHARYDEAPGVLIDLSAN